MPQKKKRCKGSALGDALVLVALEGFRKKRRLKDYERLELPRRIERAWKAERERMMRNAGNDANAFHVFEFSAADTCYEFEPTVEDVADALPEELKEMMADPRYEVTVEEEEEGAAAVFRIWINAQQEFVKALKGVVGEAEGVDV